MQQAEVAQMQHDFRHASCEIEAHRRVIGRAVWQHIHEARNRDIHLVPVNGVNDNEDDDRPAFELSDTRETPEQDLLRNEAERAAVGYVDEFLADLYKSVRGKSKQYDRMINVLWHCYLVSNGGTQLEIAEMLGVSDSLVSDYRKRIEARLQELTFNGINEARHFERALKSRVRNMLTTVDQTVTV